MPHVGSSHLETAATEPRHAVISAPKAAMDIVSRREWSAAKSVQGIFVRCTLFHDHCI